MTCEKSFKERNWYFDKDKESEKDCILETVRRIDQIQKEALIEEQCEGCEGSLIQKIFNTKPVTFYLCDGNPFRVEVPKSGCKTIYFRIEEVKGECVILRILEEKERFLDCTNFTVVLNLKCVCGIQCFPPICCKECHKGYCR